LLRKIRQIAKNMNRKFGQDTVHLKGDGAQIDVFIPSWKDRGMPRIEHSVGVEGLTKTMKFAVLAECWKYRGEPAKTWLAGSDFTISSCESNLNGMDGIVSTLRIHDRKIIGIGGVVCSPNSFDLIRNSIGSGRSIVLRLHGKVQRSFFADKSIDEIHSTMFDVFVGDDASGAHYFCERFDKFLSTHSEETKGVLGLDLYNYYCKNKPESEGGIH